MYSKQHMWLGAALCFKTHNFTLPALPLLLEAQWHFVSERLACCNICSRLHNRAQLKMPWVEFPKKQASLMNLLLQSIISHSLTNVLCITLHPRLWLLPVLVHCLAFAIFLAAHSQKGIQTIDAVNHLNLPFKHPLFPLDPQLRHTHVHTNKKVCHLSSIWMAIPCQQFEKWWNIQLSELSSKMPMLWWAKDEIEVQFCTPAFLADLATFCSKMCDCVHTINVSVACSEQHHKDDATMTFDPRMLQTKEHWVTSIWLRAAANHHSVPKMQRSSNKWVAALHSCCEHHSMCQSRGHPLGATQGGVHMVWCWIASSLKFLFASWRLRKAKHSESCCCVVSSMLALAVTTWCFAVLHHCVQHMGLLMILSRVVWVFVQNLNWKGTADLQFANSFVQSCLMTGAIQIHQNFELINLALCRNSDHQSVATENSLLQRWNIVCSHHLHHTKKANPSFTRHRFACFDFLCFSWNISCQRFGCEFFILPTGSSLVLPSFSLHLDSCMPRNACICNMLQSDASMGPPRVE